MSFLFVNKSDGKQSMCLGYRPIDISSKWKILIVIETVIKSEAETKLET